ncbi:MAG: CopG family transcriptional regulator [Halococcoides sp.]
MPTRFTVVCDDDCATTIGRLARRHDLTEEAVIQQLIDLGLEAIDDGPEDSAAIDT